MNHACLLYWWVLGKRYAINSLFAMSAVGHQFQNLILEDVEETSKELGHGYYGVVIEVIVSGTKCAAKKIRSTLIENDDEVSIGTLYCQI